MHITYHDVNEDAPVGMKSAGESVCRKRRSAHRR